MFSLKKSLTRLTLLAVASTAVVGTLSGPSHAATIGGTVGVIGDKVVFRRQGQRRQQDRSDARHRQDHCAGDESRSHPRHGVRLRPDQRQPRAVPGQAAWVNLGDGSDTFTVGGPQAFSIFTTVYGGNGDDRYQGGRDPGISRVTFIGGAYFDYADYSRATSRVLVDLGTAAGNDADDGRDAKGDQDNIHGDVEALDGSDFADSLRGNEKNNAITGGKGRDAMRGGPGDDTLFAHVTLLSTGNPTVIPEADSADLSCGTGTDRIYVDTADGAASECEDRQLIR